MTTFEQLLEIDPSADKTEWELQEKYIHILEDLIQSYNKKEQKND